MPSSLNSSTSTSGTPGQPTHAPLRARRNGSSADTSPPGLWVQRWVPSSARSRSTGSRLATTTNSASPRDASGWVASMDSVTSVDAVDSPGSEQGLGGNISVPRSLRARSGNRRTGHPWSGELAFQPAESGADRLGEELAEHHTRREGDTGRHGTHERGQVAVIGQFGQSAVGGETRE